MSTVFQRANFIAVFSTPLMIAAHLVVQPISRAYAQPPATAQPSREIDPQADKALRQMSDYISSLRSFRVQSTATDEVVLRSGEKRQQVSQSRITVERPNKVRSDRVGPRGDLVFRYDGKIFSLVGNRTGYYATAPAPPTIDAAVTALRSRLGLEIPAADLLLIKPYESLMEDTRSGSYVGIEPIEGVATHHLAFRGSEVDWQIWIQDGPQPLPRRFVITSKNEPGQPEFTVELSHWEPQMQVAGNTFTFQPPPGGTRIDFLPPREMSRRSGG